MGIMKNKEETINVATLFLQADNLIRQKYKLFRSEGEWFDGFTRSEAWRQRRHDEIKSLEKKLSTGETERSIESIQRSIESIQERLKNEPSFILLAHEAWQAITDNPKKHLKIIFLFRLLHRKHFEISSFENYPFKDIWDNSSNPEYEDEAARSAIFDANPENYQIVKEALDAICSQNGDPKADDECTHSVNFTSVIWYRHKYTFNDTQAKVVKLLWDAWRDPTKVGVIERDIGAVIETFAKQYRLVDTFYSKGKYHEAWGVMIKRTGKGIYALCKP